MMIAKVTGAANDDHDPDAPINPDEAMKKMMPVDPGASIRSLIKGNNKDSQFDIDLKDLSDFRVPVSTFKEYSVVMKGLNPECQVMFLNALGVDTTHKSAKIGWESFISIYCLLKYNCST